MIPVPGTPVWRHQTRVCRRQQPHHLHGHRRQPLACWVSTCTPHPPEEASATSPSCGKAPGVSTQWEPGVGTSEGTWAHALARPAPQVLGETPSSRPRFPPSHRLQLCDSHSHLQLTPRANPALRPPGVHTLGKGKPRRHQRRHLTPRATARGPRFAPGRKLFSSGAGASTVPAPELKTRGDPTGHPVEMDPIRQGGHPPGTGGQVPDTRPAQSTRAGRTGKEGGCRAEGRSGSETLTQPERRADEARTSVLHTPTWAYVSPRSSHEGSPTRDSTRGCQCKRGKVGGGSRDKRPEPLQGQLPRPQHGPALETRHP